MVDAFEQRSSAEGHQPADLASSARYQTLLGLLAQTLSAPIITLTLRDRSDTFFAAAVGLDTLAFTTRTIPLLYSICQYPAVTNAPVVVEDMRNDPRFAQSQPLIERGVQSLLGVPLTLPDGSTIGALSAIATTPRSWSARDHTAIGLVAQALRNEIRRTKVYTGETATDTPELAVIDLNQLMRDVAVLMVQGGAPGIVHELDLADGLPLVTVGADWYALTQHILADLSRALGAYQARIAIRTSVRLIVEDDAGATHAVVITPTRPGCYVSLIISDVDSDLVARVVAMMASGDQQTPLFPTLPGRATQFRARGTGLILVPGDGMPAALHVLFALGGEQ